MRTLWVAFVVLVLIPFPASSQEIHPRTPSAADPDAAAFEGSAAGISAIARPTVALDLLGPVRPPAHPLAPPLVGFPRAITAVEAASPFLVGMTGSLLASILWVNWGPNWEDADRGEEREDLGWYVGPVLGGTIGVWIEGSRKRKEVSPLALFAGGTAGLLLGALHAASTDGESLLSYAALGILPPLGGTVGWALTAADRR